VRPTGRKPLGRHVEQFERARGQLLPDRVGFRVGIARGQRTGGDTRRLQCAHLITHQGNQRRDHQRDTGPDQRGQLKAQRLAATGRHDRKRILPCSHGIDDRLLPGRKAS